MRRVIRRVIDTVTCVDLSQKQVAVVVISIVLFILVGGSWIVVISGL